MNDRSLRQIVSSLGGVANGFPREDGFDITVASEVMAVFCLATGLEDLEQRLGKMIAGYTRDRKPVLAADLQAAGAMTVLLKDALAPNLVQTLEGNPAFVHGGPFANIAHGCNSAMATRTALKLGDYVVTEAGFGADLGAEKFFDIKCRKARPEPDAAVVVATVRALKMHGGVAKDALARRILPPSSAFANLERRAQRAQSSASVRWWRSSRFGTDTEAELTLIRQRCRDELHVDAYVCEHWAKGAGIEELARHVVELCEAPHYRDGRGFEHLYPDDMPLWDKMRTIAREIYGAEDIIADQRVRDQFKDKPPATATSRSASPRPSTASRPTPT